MLKAINIEIKPNYIKTNEWKNVAGSYKIQGFAEVYIKSINGSYSNVVGLPLFQTNNLLGSVGLLIPPLENLYGIDGFYYNSFGILILFIIYFLQGKLNFRFGTTSWKKFF